MSLGNKVYIILWCIPHCRRLKEKTMAIIPCNCENEYQDKKYGRYLRVHNPGKSKVRDHTKWRCSVCLHEKERQN